MFHFRCALLEELRLEPEDEYGPSHHYPFWHLYNRRFVIALLEPEVRAIAWWLDHIAEVLCTGTLPMEPEDRHLVIRGDQWRLSVRSHYRCLRVRGVPMAPEGGVWRVVGEHELTYLTGRVEDLSVLSAFLLQSLEKKERRTFDYEEYEE